MTDAVADLEIRMAMASDAGDFGSHIVRHLAESGLGGVHFGPVSVANRSDVMADCEQRWALPVTEPGWGRTWLLISPSSRERARVVGHVELRGKVVESALHRADMSVGIERAFRRQGYGLRLTQAALDFALWTPAIDWIDLCVFSTNSAALRLYERLGFNVTGEVKDAFRMPDGAKVDDVSMSLRLERRR